MNNLIKKKIDIVHIFHLVKKPLIKYLIHLSQIAGKKKKFLSRSSKVGIETKCNDVDSSSETSIYNQRQCNRY